MKLQTPVDINPIEKKFTYSDSILFVGSCFATEIGRRCSERYFKTMVNPFGVLFNPASIADCLGLLEGYGINPYGCSFIPEDVISTPQGFCSFHHHTSFARPTAQEFLDNANETLAQASEFYHRKQWVVVTLGTSFVYTDKDSGMTVSNCHKLPSSKFERSMLSVDETVSYLGHYVGGNPDRQWIFTVSPVRHAADGLHQNQISKSNLLLAVDQIVARYQNASYFPAYEIMMDELRDYRFYADDMVHPSQLAADYIFDRFMDWAFDPSQKPMLDQSNSLRQLMNHRPMNPESPQAASFIADREKRLAEFLEKRDSL